MLFKIRFVHHTPFPESDIFFRDFNIRQIKISVNGVTNTCLFVCIVLLSSIITSSFPIFHKSIVCKPCSESEADHKAICTANTCKCSASSNIIFKCRFSFITKLFSECFFFFGEFSQPLFICGVSSEEHSCGSMFP